MLISSNGLKESFKSFWNWFHFTLEINHITHWVGSMHPLYLLEQQQCRIFLPRSMAGWENTQTLYPMWQAIRSGGKRSRPSLGLTPAYWSYDPRHVTVSLSLAFYFFTMGLTIPALLLDFSKGEMRWQQKLPGMVVSTQQALTNVESKSHTLARLV